MGAAGALCIAGKAEPSEAAVGGPAGASGSGRPFQNAEEARAVPRSFGEAQPGAVMRLMAGSSTSSLGPAPGRRVANDNNTRNNMQNQKTDADHRKSQNSNTKTQDRRITVSS